MADNFYNGRPLDLGLERYMPEIETGELLHKILPLRPDAPIYLPEGARPNFGAMNSLVEFQDIEFIVRPIVGWTP